MSVEEKLNQAKGSIKEGVGKAIGDEKNGLQHPLPQKWNWFCPYWSKPCSACHGYTNYLSQRKYYKQ